MRWAWKGLGNLQLASGATVVLQSEREDGLGFAPRGIQLMGGTLQLQGHYQIAPITSVQFASAGTNVLALNGLAFGYLQTQFSRIWGKGVLDLGNGGVLHLLGQDPNDSWEGLLTRRWKPYSGGILFEGGLFSPTQLQGITFEGYAAGARVHDGQLLPAGKLLSKDFR